MTFDNEDEEDNYEKVALFYLYKNIFLKFYVSFIKIALNEDNPIQERHSIM